MPGRRSPAWAEAVGPAACVGRSRGEERLCSGRTCSWSRRCRPGLCCSLSLWLGSSPCVFCDQVAHQDKPLPFGLNSPPAARGMGVPSGRAPCLEPETPDRRTDGQRPVPVALSRWKACRCVVRQNQPADGAMLRNRVIVEVLVYRTAGFLSCRCYCGFVSMPAGWGGGSAVTQSDTRDARATHTSSACPGVLCECLLRTGRV